MNRLTKTLVAAAAAVALTLGATGCTTVNTAPDAVALHYSGGAFSKQEFVECVPASTRQIHGPGEHYYYYPVGQRTFSFEGYETSESGPILTNTADSQKVAVSGFVTFELNVEFGETEKGKTDCATLREFHERIGYKTQAYFEGNPDMYIDGDEKDRQGAADNDQWVAFLKQYVQTPLDMVMDDNGQKYMWRDLFQDQATQDAFRAGVQADLPGAVNTALQSDEFFTVTGVTISTPDPDDGLIQKLKETEEANEAKKTQDAKNAVAQSKFDSMVDCKESGLSESTCVSLRVIEDGTIPIYIIPDGQSVQVAS